MTVTDKDITKFYNSKAWRMLRQQKLLINPLCQTCQMENKIEAARQVHHACNLRRAWESRYDIKLLFSLCGACHAQIETEIYVERQAAERQKQDEELRRLGG
jgi:5-methylcytosine-specific restriction endonuclease McrA